MIFFGNYMLMSCLSTLALLEYLGHPSLRGHLSPTASIAVKLEKKIIIRLCKTYI